jgi:hypothetical protein
MKKHLNKFSIFVWFAIQFSPLALAMEQPPLTPRTHAIIALSQQLKSHEETIALLCQARGQDMQLAQLRESKLEKQLDEIKKELQLTKQAIPCIMPVAEDEQSGPDSQKSVAVLLLKQAGSKGALIAQAIITRHYVCQALQTLIQKTKFTPRVKALLNDATPEIANLAAGASVYATARLVEQAPKAIGLFASIRQRLGSMVWLVPDDFVDSYDRPFYSARPIILHPEPLNKEGFCVAAILGATSLSVGWIIAANHEAQITQAMEELIKALKELK